MTETADPPIRVGVSACLLGEPVRYDAGHKRDAFLVDTFGRFVEWLPVCPEVEVGMGAPREPVRLSAVAGQTRMLAVTTGVDHTDRMRDYARRRAAELARENLCGYVLKSRSPSCGMERVKVHQPKGPPKRTGRGLFAEALLAAAPNLPVEEEGRLCDARLRENFVERVFAYHRLRQLFRPRWTIGQLVAFQAAHKLQLMAHAPAGQRSLGRLVAGAKQLSRSEVQSQYESQFMQALAAIATPRRQTNALQHAMGFFKRTLDEASRCELHGLVADYFSGLVPLIVPITLIRHHARRLGVEQLTGQTYLEPHPKELMLRNHV